jgi:peptide/nickel transport system permease protein
VSSHFSTLVDESTQELEEIHALSIGRRFDVARALGIAGTAFFVLVVVLGVFAPLVAPHNPVQQDLTHRLAPPIWQGGSASHLFGTDGLGRDILSRLIYGARESLLISCSAVAIATAAGTTLGLVAGYSAGLPSRLATLVDKLILAVTEMTLAIPGLILAIAVVALFGATVKNLIIILAVFGWVVFTRLARGIVLSLHRRAFVEAATVLGAGHRRIVIRHMLPYVLPQIVVVAALQIGFMILVESALGFLGLGVQPPTVTWGNMVAEGRDYLNTSPWEGVLSGVAITLTVLALSFMADLIRARIAKSSAIETR